MFLYYARGLVRWLGGVHYGDIEAMKAEGQARLEPLRHPGYASTGYCMLAVGYVESGVVGNHEYAALHYFHVRTSQCLGSTKLGGKALGA